MKFTPKSYSSILVRALRQAKSEDEKSIIIQNFIELLKRHHALSGGRAIIPILRDALKRVFQLHSVKITSAKPLQDRIISTIRSIIPPNSEIHFETDPTCIGGLRILLDNELLIDSTIEQRVNQLFHL